MKDVRTFPKIRAWFFDRRSAVNKMEIRGSKTHIAQIRLVRLN